MLRILEVRYDAIKGNFIREIEELNSYYVTCDNWTHCSGHSYLGVTVHYRKKSLQMASWCLGCIPLEERSTADYLTKSLLQVFQDFGVSIEKFYALISDGEAANKKASIQIVGKPRHIICFAHVMAHILPDALKHCSRLTSVITKLKCIITAVQRSNVASEKLKKLQLSVNQF